MEALQVSFAQELFGASDAEIFQDHGLLRPPCVMAHCVQMTLREEELLRSMGCAVAHCPLSNFFFAHGALPVKQLLQRGLKVGLGTDVAGGYSPSMLSAVRAAVLASKCLQFRYLENTVGAAACRCEPLKAKEEDDLDHFQALYLATLGGAESLNLADHLGTFDVGKRFDAVLLKGSKNQTREV